MTVQEIKRLRETEDRVEFKEAKRNFNFDGGRHSDPAERRRCVLGYVVALANEGGGYLIFGVKEKKELPHEIVGTTFGEGKTGALEDEIYKRLSVRVKIEELFDSEKTENNRVLVFKIPSRNLGDPLTFEGVPLMRIGDSLRAMSNAELFNILSERAPDFSATICEGLTFEDLDKKAIEKMKIMYADKQKNPSFLQIRDERMLSDLQLAVNGKLTYAALILLGKSDTIDRYLPQSRIIWEYRNTETQIHYDRRQTITEPFITGIDSAWNLIDQPTLNLNHPIQAGLVVYNIYDFNREVIRESILNSYAHRDYTLTSDVVIKQYPQMIEIINPGGFPKGVSIDNILTVSSTPRNKLIADVLEKTGLVERSGQGVDKIYSETLAEGKQTPDYTRTNPHQVTLRIRTQIADESFAVFIRQYRNRTNHILSAEQVIALSEIRDGNIINIHSETIEQLKQAGLIKNVERSGLKYILSDDYFRIANKPSKIGEQYVAGDIEHILLSLQGSKKKIGDMEQDLSEYLTRNQLKHLLPKLLKDEIITSEGQGRGTSYSIFPKYAHLNSDQMLASVISDLKKKYE
ncbi:MAG: putative DNA binding domain-containing protein [Dysgonamonadaceae bacterium]|jgi:ATP-dependent DNA helicase RecG|nr:putative DNA binding domain-containing protein [Dysgonamonadaceae bacterium]